MTKTEILRLSKKETEIGKEKESSINRVIIKQPPIILHEKG